MRHYAIRHDEDGNEKRVLVEIECDGCNARIKPGSDIAESGWVKEGWDDKRTGERVDSVYCPDCRS